MYTCLVCTLGDLSSDTAYGLSENADAVLPLSRISSAALASCSFLASALQCQLGSNQWYTGIQTVFLQGYILQLTRPSLCLRLLQMLESPKLLELLL